MIGIERLGSRRNDERQASLGGRDQIDQRALGHHGGRDGLEIESWGHELGLVGADAVDHRVQVVTGNAQVIGDLGKGS